MKIKINTIADKKLQDKSIVDKIVSEIKEIESKYSYINHEFVSLVMIDVDQIILKYQQRGYQIEKEFTINEFTTEGDIIINLKISLKKKKETKKKEETE